MLRLWLPSGMAVCLPRYTPADADGINAGWRAAEASDWGVAWKATLSFAILSGGCPTRTTQGGPT